MKQSLFGLNLESGGLPNSFVLIPETLQDREALKAGLADDGVKDSLAFCKNGISGCLRFPGELTWTDDGAVCIPIELHDNKRIEAWFWLVATKDGTSRKFAWWNLNDREINAATPWS